MKYNIEGGFDFYSALKNDTKDDTKNDEPCCLITRMQLTDDFIQMQCGHKFNYLPLYNALVQHTKLSIISGISRLGYIVCPYCRHSQQTLLPYNERFKLVVGVNLYPRKMCNKETTTMVPKAICELVLSRQCTSDHAYQLPCGKHYCEFHKITGISIEIQKLNHSTFLMKKEILDKKKSDKLAKNILKQEKKKEKEKENTTTGCIQLIKTGPRKGLPCGCKKTAEDGICFRHKPK